MRTLGIAIALMVVAGVGVGLFVSRAGGAKGKDKPSAKDKALANPVVLQGAGAKVPAAGEKVLFTFAIFGDNKSGGPWLDVTFNHMRAIRPSFVIGMGDHYKKKGSMQTFDRSVRESFGHARFWPTQGDNEDEYWGGEQDAVKAQHKYFVKIGLFDEKGKPARPEIKDSNAKMMDYYARLHVAGMTVHLVSLYDHDSMKLKGSSKTWADRVMLAIKKDKPVDEPWIVMSHDGMWWLENFKRGHAVYSCDLLMGASWHVYAFFGAQHGGTNLAFNTSAVGRQDDSWYAVMALKDKFVLLNMDPDEFKVKGVPGCVIKPFGKPGYPAEPGPWLKLMVDYAKTVKTPWGPMPTAEAKTPASAPAEE